MPYISTVTTKKIDEKTKKDLTRLLGEAIEILPGKSEKWLMLRFEGGAEMAFRGDCDSDTAMLEVSLLGKADPAALDRLTARLSEIVTGTLGVPSDRIYVKYFETDTWGYDGGNL